MFLLVVTTGAGQTVGRIAGMIVSRGSGISLVIYFLIPL